MNNELDCTCYSAKLTGKQYHDIHAKNNCINGMFLPSVREFISIRYTIKQNYADREQQKCS